MLPTELSALRLAERAPGQSAEAFYMGLMDRVRAQATQLAQQAQDAAQEGKARLDQAQSGRRGDMLLRQLGALVFAERTGRGTADSQARIDQLINDISAHERENGLNLADPQPGFGSVFGQSVWGQSSSAQPPAGQGDQGPSGFGQPEPGQAQPAGSPASPQAAPGQAAPGQAAPGQAGSGEAGSGEAGSGEAPGQGGSAQTDAAQTPSPAGGAGAMPSVDTTTSFFPAPCDEAPGATPHG
jgi:hypothetical protein